MRHPNWIALGLSRLRNMQAEYDATVVDYDECPVCGSPLEANGRCSDVGDNGCVFHN